MPNTPFAGWDSPMRIVSLHVATEKMSPCMDDGTFPSHPWSWTEKISRKTAATLFFRQNPSDDGLFPSSGGQADEIVGRFCWTIWRVEGNATSATNGAGMLLLWVVSLRQISQNKFLFIFSVWFGNYNE